MALVSRRTFALGVVLSPFASSAFANADPRAEAYVTSITEEVIGLANSGLRGKQLKARFSNLLTRYVNLRQIANFALGPYQKKLPAADREKFYALVGNYAASLFVYYVDDFRGTGLEIRETATQGQFTTIQSAIRLKGGGSEQVRWRLVGGGSGYRVSDVNLKGVWMDDLHEKAIQRCVEPFKRRL